MVKEREGRAGSPKFVVHQQSAAAQGSQCVQGCMGRAQGCSGSKGMNCKNAHARRVCVWEVQVTRSGEVHAGVGTACSNNRQRGGRQQSVCSECGREAKKGKVAVVL